MLKWKLDLGTSKLTYLQESLRLCSLKDERKW